MTSALEAGPARLRRRAAAAESLSAVARIIDRLDAEARAAGHVELPEDLRAAVRAVLPVAAKTGGFDVTLSAGAPPNVAVRVRHDGSSVSAQIVMTTEVTRVGGPHDGSDHVQPADDEHPRSEEDSVALVAAETAASPGGSVAAVELAALLRRAGGTPQ